MSLSTVLNVSFCGAEAKIRCNISSHLLLLIVIVAAAYIGLQLTGRSLSSPTGNYYSPRLFLSLVGVTISKHKCQSSYVDITH